METTGRITFDLPTHEREKVIALAQEQDRSVAALCRLGVRLVLTTRVDELPHDEARRA